jgi:hypothetical protein
MTYNEIVRDCLHITDKFFQDHRTTIANRLAGAHDEMVKGEATASAPGTAPKILLQDTIYGINQCIHLASSLAVLGGAGHLEDAVKNVRADKSFGQLDPTTVLTIATLYYLLHDLGPKALPTSKSPNVVLDIRRRFDMVNWMIGPEAMKALGIKPV